MPAAIMPTIEGIFRRSRSIGAKRMMLSTMKNIHVGSVMGRYVVRSVIREMNMQDVQKIKMRALVLGLLSFGLPITLGFVANHSEVVHQRRRRRNGAVEHNAH